MAYEPVTPAAPAADMRALRRHLKLPEDSAESDAELQVYLAAAQDALMRDLECPLTTQEFVETFDSTEIALGEGRVRLHMRPVQAVLAVYDQDETPIPGSAYELAPKDTFVWDRSLALPRSLLVRYRAGWDPKDLPPALRVAAMMQTADLYAMRETQQVVTGSIAINPSAERLTRPFRRFN